MSIIRTKTSQYDAPARRSIIGQTRGFSLMELLVVIAIIAILAAIIYAAVSRAIETSRRAQSISNLHLISQGLARYVSDHDGKYPQVLFAYSDGVHSMHAIATAYAANSPQYNQYMQGIYPTYVSDPTAFTDPNNRVVDVNSTATVGPINVNTLQVVLATNTRNVLAKDPTPRSFYQADAFDVSEEIVGPSELADGVHSDPPLTFVPRYQPAWTSVMDPGALGYTPATFPTATPVGQDGITYDEYSRQLDNPSSTDDTYVTCTTYHVTNENFVIVLFKDGTAKAMDASKFLATAANNQDTSDITADAHGVAHSRFWTITPTGAH